MQSITMDDVNIDNISLAIEFMLFLCRSLAQAVAITYQMWLRGKKDIPVYYRHLTVPNNYSVIFLTVSTISLPICRLFGILSQIIAKVV